VGRIGTQVVLPWRGISPREPRTASHEDELLIERAEDARAGIEWFKSIFSFAD
jgi:hypothetical protein